MPHVTLDSDGSPVYRTKVLPFQQAVSFARCLDANRDRFRQVEIIPTGRRSDRAHVRFQPINEARRAAMLAELQGRRQAKAEEEGPDFVFWPDPAEPKRSFVFNPHSGETYEFWMGMCSCPDKRGRCQKLGCHCKHEIERDRRFADGTLYKTDKQTPEPAPKTTLDEKFATRGLSVNLDF